MKKTLLNIAKVVIFFSVGLGILYYLYSSFSAKYVVDCMAKGKTEADCDFGTKLIEDFKSARPFWIFMIFVTFTISNISRAMRWKMLIKPLGREARLINTFLCTVIGYFTNLFLPRAGEVIKAGVLSKYENIPAEKVMGTVVLDRLLDVISILIVSVLALLLEYDKIWGYFGGPMKAFFGGFGWKTLLLVGGLVLGAVLLLFFFRSTFAETGFYKKIAKVALGFKEGILSIGKLDNVPLFLFHSVLIWVMYFMMVYVSFFAFEPTENLPPVAALLAFVFAAWGIVIPSPGGMGSYHYLTIVALGLYGISEFDAASFSNISFCTIQLATNISFGILGFAIIGYLNRNYKPLDLVDDAGAHKS